MIKREKKKSTNMKEKKKKSYQMLRLRTKKCLILYQNQSNQYEIKVISSKYEEVYQSQSKF